MKVGVMRRYLLLLFALFFTVQFVSQNASGGCMQSCLLYSAEPAGNKNCYTEKHDGSWASIGAPDTWSCSVNERPNFVPPNILDFFYSVPNCAKGNNVCMNNACPNILYPDPFVKDGDPCTVKVPCSDGFMSCADKVLTGVWDGSESRCVTCNTGFPLPKSEEALIAQGSNYYVYVYSQAQGLKQQFVGASCLSGTTVVSQPGDSKFEAACGAQVACDEKTVGESCGQNRACDEFGKCVSKGCTPCDDGTECGFCNSAGDFCEKNVNNKGVLKIKDKVNCNLECVKYSTKYAEKQNTGPHPYVGEICYDTPVIDPSDPAKKIYSRWFVDEYAGSGAQIMETSCDPFKCIQTPVACGGADALMRDGIDTNNKKLPKTIASNPITATSSYYCDSRGTGGSGGGGNPGCSTCGDPAVCEGECVPGEPPYKYGPGCAKVEDCSRCGCPPAQYPDTTVSCNAGTGFCSYDKPPGIPGEPPDCPTSVPDGEYNKTYLIKTLYLLSGSNTGSFLGYNYSGSWQADAGIKSGISAPSYSSPAVFFNNAETYLITGSGDGTFLGFNWTGSSWSGYPAIVSGLPDIGDNSKPSIFYMDGKWNMIAGNSTALFGFTYSGGMWALNNSLVSGLSNEACSPAPAVFYYGAPYLISGNCTGDFSGYYWNGTDWEADPYIVSGLLNTGTFASPYAFYNSSNLNLITGKGNGQFSGYNWNGTEWLPNATLTSGLAPGASSSAPAVFRIDSTYTKTIKYNVRFPLESMTEYPNAGSQCF